MVASMAVGCGSKSSSSDSSTADSSTAAKDVDDKVITIGCEATTPGWAQTDEDGNISGITFPCGQSLPDKVGTDEAKLWYFGGGSSVSTSGNIAFAATSKGFASEDGCGIGYQAESGGVSLYDLLMPGIVWVKK